MDPVPVHAVPVHKTGSCGSGSAVPGGSGSHSGHHACSAFSLVFLTDLDLVELLLACLLASEASVRRFLLVLGVQDSAQGAAGRASVPPGWSQLPQGFRISSKR